MRVSDYIAHYLYERGIRYVFGITGGGAAGINDGFAKFGKIQYISNHHEQASAYAAVGMSKVSNELSVVNPTTGCAGTNCITGVLDAWQDYSPVLFLSGNVNRAQMTFYPENKHLRKLGVQEADIITLVKPITKYADVVNSPEEIISKLKFAIDTALTAPMGPVWLDIPTDIQLAELEVEPLNFEKDIPPLTCDHSIPEDIKKELETASRPLILIGNGVRLSGATNIFQKTIENFKIPFVATYLGLDVADSENSLNVGRVGVKGDRAGNFALHNCDLLLVLGSSLNTPVTGYKVNEFAPNAKIITIDIDGKFNPKLNIFKNINCDIKTFLSSLCSSEIKINCSAWNEKCKHWKDKWNINNEPHKTEDGKINLYHFINHLNEISLDSTHFVSDTGSAMYVPGQGIKIKKNKRFITSGGQADMGFALPAAIGVALMGNPTLVITGDGSFQSNIQELATVRYLNLPIKIFVLNNNGYLSIRTTQNKLFKGRVMGTGPGNGIFFPKLEDIAKAYKINYALMDKIDEKQSRWLETPEPMIIEVICPENQLIIPTIGAKLNSNGRIEASPLYDMFPHLTPEDIEKEMYSLKR